VANGYVLTFTNDLKVYLTGDTGPTSDMATIVRGLYHPFAALLRAFRKPEFRQRHIAEMV
jgi:hypothetical protein